MGTEVLLPQDLFAAQRYRGHIAPSFHRRKNIPATGNLTSLIVNRRPNTNNNNNKKTSPKPDSNKKRSVESKKSRKDDVIVTKPVVLLRRGESLDSLTSKIKSGNPNNPNPKSNSPIRKPIDDLAVCGTGRIGPESPEMLPKQIRLVAPPQIDTYAGSAFYSSPSPKSVPLPSFFNNNNKKQDNDDDSATATRDLRRLLRLD